MKLAIESTIVRRMFRQISSGLCCGMLVLILIPTVLIVSSPLSVNAIENADYQSVPPFMATFVKPNVLFVLDNSNSMDEDVDGAAVGSDSANSKSEIARQAIKLIIEENKERMRIGLMAYKQAGISRKHLHNSFYYCNYDPSTYDPTAVPTPKDPSSNTKRFPNPDDPGNYIYYDTALPFYAGDDYGSAFCYSSNFDYFEPNPPVCTATSYAACHSYWCFRDKTGTLDTPIGTNFNTLQNTYGYQSYWFSSQFYPTDSDVAAGFNEFGLEMSWVHVGLSWFSNSSPGSGMLHEEIMDSTAGHINHLNNLLGTSQFINYVDVPLRNAGLTPLAGTIESARKYFSGNLPSDEFADAVSPPSPIQNYCQQNFVILLTDGLPSTDKNGNIGNTDDLIDELKDEIIALRSTNVIGFPDDFDVKTYVVGFAIPEGLGDKLDELAVAGGTAIDGEALLADNATELATKLRNVFLQISREVSSGSSASVISNTRSGQGVVYQSVFYPEYNDNLVPQNSVKWVGSLQALFVDDYGNLREDTNHNLILDTHNETCQTFVPPIPGWCDNGIKDTEDVDGDGRLDIDEDAQDIEGHPDWKNNGNFDTEDVDGNGILDIDEDHQSIDGHLDWDGNGGLPDTEDLDGDGHLDIEEDDQLVPGHPEWQGNLRLDREDVDEDGHIDVFEDGNGDGFYQSEDLDSDCHLDIDEDGQDIAGYSGWKNNGVLDSEDVDGDGTLDLVNEDNNLPLFLLYPSWVGNGVLDTEDTNGDGVLSAAEDLNNNGILETEDISGGVADGHLDVNEDGNGNGVLDTEDADGDGTLDGDEDSIFPTDYVGWSSTGDRIWTGNGLLDSEDLDGDCKGDVNEDTDGDGILDTEDINNNGILDSSEDTNGNFILDTEDYDGDGVLDVVDEDTDGDGILDTEDADLDGNFDDAEDLNGNGKIDFEQDYNNDGILDNSDLIIVYTEDDEGNAIVHKYFDENGNGRLDIEDETTFDPPIPAWFGNNILNTEDVNNNGTLDPGEDINGNGLLDTEDFDGDGVLDTEKLTGNWAINEVAFLWESNNWLNEMTGADVVTQRPYGTAAEQRHIVTFVDLDRDDLMDPGELIDFSAANWDPLYHYLNLYSPVFGVEPSWVTDGRSTAATWNDFLQHQSLRIINYIRGHDQGEYASSSSPSYTLPQMRSRQVDYDDDMTVETWRLGDIIYSSPTLVGRPSEGYHLLYRDESYGEFAAHYQNRRQVIYVGANDGMLHAFNGGFYNDEIKGLSSQSHVLADTYTDENGNGSWDSGEPLTRDLDGDGTYDDGNGGEVEYEIGSELWAYVPFNLLPHLYWLTEPTYQHVYYVDLRPKIFDAKIFFDSAGNVLDTDHPNGWGTVMVVGMRFGGGSIQVDYAKDGDAYDDSIGGDGDFTMKSAYIIFDITNPKVSPKVLGEVTFDELGYTTCYPTVIPMNPEDENQWTLVFGSGPDESGAPGTDASLDDVVSDTPGKLFMVDLRKMVSDKTGLYSVDGTTSANARKGHFVASSFDTDTFVSDIVTVDYDLDYYADALYFGTVAGSESAGWGGKLRHVVLHESADMTTWENEVLFDLTNTGGGKGQPVTAAPTIGIDADNNKWVFWGTGRFYSGTDKTNIDKQSFYGVKETWGIVDRGDLLNVTDAEVSYDETVTNIGSVATFGELENAIDGTSGWVVDLLDSSGAEVGDRNLGQAALLGEIVSFTTYLPSNDVCSVEGTSELYAVYYRTGTAYHKAVIGSTWSDANGDGLVQPGELLVKKSTGIGSGMALSPNLHVGRGDGTKVFIQTSQGGISSCQENSPGLMKSHKSYWRQK